MNKVAEAKRHFEYTRSLESVNESGGLFAVWGSAHASQMAYFGLHALQHRGQTSAGIISSDGVHFKSHRARGLINHVFKQEEMLHALEGKHAIGQVRSETVADRDDDTNIQPLLYHFNDQTIAITHNGNITNAMTLRKMLEEEGAVLSSNSAAELLVHLIRKSEAKNFEQAFKESLQALKGGFNFCLLTEDGLYGAVDRRSFRPLVIGQLPDGGYVLASETCALHMIGAKYIDELSAGQYVVINDDGYHIHHYTKDVQVALEPMEFIYFARPDSDIAGVNVHAARKEMGRRLAKEHPAESGEIVIGVPNSSLSAASGYAEASGLPYEIGLIKHQYTGRTFIQPTQDLREQGVRSKLSAVVSLVKGRSIVLVDDSIVRGTTIQHLVRLLKESGAREIHLRIASPPLRFPNYYGIDVNQSSDMVAANHTVQDLNDLFQTDSLGYLSVDGLIESINLPFTSPYQGVSVSAFIGNYAEDICDFKDGFQASLTPLQKQILRGEYPDE